VRYHSESMALNTFETVRTLLNPVFDGYKLAPSSSAVPLQSHALPFALKSTASPPTLDAARVGWRDMRSRARANELAASVDGDAEVAWIDGQRNEVYVANMVR